MSRWNRLKELLMGAEPENINGIDNLSALYWRDYLLNLVKGRFDVNVPTYCSRDYILNCLLLQGKFVVTEIGGCVYALECGIAGINAYNRPTEVIISNPVLGDHRRTIGVDCVLWYLYDDIIYRTINQMLDKYSYQLAAVDAGIDINLLNTRVAMIFDVPDKSMVSTAKEIYKSIARGDPAVFVSKSLKADGERLNFYNLNVVNTFIVDKMQDAKRTIINEFLTAIGINSANTDKRERLTVSEVDSNNQEIDLSTAYIQDNLRTCQSGTDKLFPGSGYAVKLKDFGGESNTQSNARGNGTNMDA